MSRQPSTLQRTAASVSLSEVSVSYNGTDLAVEDATLTVESGTALVLLGPSGSGKTTILRAIAGLERPVTGSVSIGGHVVASGSTWVPPERRGVGMVFQDGALFPHLSVSENIAFGLDRRAPRRSEQVTELLAMVDLSGLGDRRPDTLSGGQRQRVALARALAPEPSVLLFDETFSALDASLRHRVRADVNQILRDIGVTSIFVTHDQDEAFALGDQVAVLRDSHIEQVGSPSQLYRDPITPWVAGFVGEANLLDVQASAGLVTTPFGAMALREPYDGPVTALVRPEHLKAAPGDDAEVEDLEFYGHDARYDLRFADGTMLSLRSADVEPLSRGDRVTVVYNGPPAVAWPISER